MNNELIFRKSVSEDDKKILALFKDSFNHELRADWWKWFSYECPTGLNRTYVIEDKKNQILAASYSLLPIKLLLNGKLLNASLCTNVNTHPKYRGLGLFTRLGHFALDHEEKYNSPISLGMPNKNAYPGHMKVGWEVIFKLPFLVKTDCEKKQNRCHEIKEFNDSFDKFYKRIEKKFSFIISKNYRYMNWRVAFRPNIQYKKFIYEEDKKLKGYVVLKHFDDKEYKKSHILDIHAENKDILGELIATAESFAAGRNELNMWTNINNPYHNYFLKQGFFERTSDDLLIIHFNYGKKWSIEPGNMWFCLADNDVY
jgi:hypothetical protein